MYSLGASPPGGLKRTSLMKTSEERPACAASQRRPSISRDIGRLNRFIFIWTVLMCYKKALLTTAAHQYYRQLLASLPDTQGGPMRVPPYWRVPLQGRELRRVYLVVLLTGDPVEHRFVGKSYGDGGTASDISPGRARGQGRSG